MKKKENYKETKKNILVKKQNKKSKINDSMKIIEKVFN